MRLQDRLPQFNLLQNNKKSKLKAYISLFSSSVTRAVRSYGIRTHIITTEFIKSFKILILRRGKPNIVYSDNAKTLEAGAKWLENINKDQKLLNLLHRETIIWDFNVPEAPWWGGQFERLISLIKSSLYMTIGKVHVTWAKLEEVLNCC